MIANLFIVLFLIGMTYWWGSVQGLFSALLHLLVTLFAAAIAIGLWEPLTFILMGRIPMYAWGVALICPFVLLLMGLGWTADKLVPGNVRFPPIVSMIGGGLCGLAAGILTAGLTVVGLGFLPLGNDIAGYQPYAVGNNGKVEPRDQLWVPVDRLAIQWMNRLSQGSLSPISNIGASLALYQPKLYEQAGMFRMRYDKNASVVAIPKSIEVTGYYVTNTLGPETVEKIGPAIPEALAQAGQLVIVDTQWKSIPGTYDTDSTLRLPPTQVRLGCWFDQHGQTQAELYEPIAVSQRQEDAARDLHIFDNKSRSAYGVSQQELFGWIFAIPDGHTPKFVLLRHTRVMLPDPPEENAELLAAALGRPPVPKEPEPEPAAVARRGSNRRRRSAPKPPELTQAPSELGGRRGTASGVIGVAIELTDALPEPISKNMARQLNIQGDAVMSGFDDVSRSPGRPSEALRATRLSVPKQSACVRIRLDHDRAQSWLGATRTMAAGFGGIFVEDNRGQKWTPDGYVWARSNRTQRIKYEPGLPIRSAKELPHTEMEAGEALYLYFVVQRGIEVRELWIGSAHQRIEPPLVIPK